MRSIGEENGMAAGVVDGAVCRRVATVGFWDGYARWYKLWLEHNNYHAPVIELLETNGRAGLEGARHRRGERRALPSPCRNGMRCHGHRAFNRHEKAALRGDVP